MRGPSRTIAVEATTGVAFEASEGDLVRVVDLEGRQVGDLTAYDPADGAWLSAAHTRGILGSLRLSVGDCLYSDEREAMLRIVADDVGTHDITFPPCDRRRYELDYASTDHANCRDNLVGALAERGVTADHPPVVNLFMNIPLRPDGTFEIAEPLSDPGDAITLQVVRDLVLALSACPMDHNPCNGWKPTDLAVEVTAGAEPARSGGSAAGAEGNP